MSQLVTGEAVALDLRPARLASRIVARGIDLAIEFAVLLVFQMLGAVLLLADPSFGYAVIILVVVMLIVGYPVAFETLWRGKTPGKAVMGLRVVRDDGGPIRFRHALTRGLLNIVDLWLSSGSVGVITSLLSTRGKRVGDIVAGTFVVQERVPRQHLAPIFMPPQLARWATTLDLSRLPDDLALAVRGFLGRAAQMRPEARERLGADLATAVGSCVTPPPPAGTPGWAYLSAVVAERRRRDEARRPPGSGPAPWQQSPGPGWGPAPQQPPWSASAPPVGAPPAVGPPPRVGAPPRDPGPPRVPPGPSPQWGPQPVPPSAPPESPSAPSRAPAPAAPAPAVRAPAAPAPAGRAEPPGGRPPAGGFAPPA